MTTIPWIGLLAAAFVLGLLMNRFLPAYFAKKGENLATKEDISTITRSVEQVRSEFLRSLEEQAQQNRLLLEQTKPLTAEETLRREAYFNARQSAYLAAIDVMLKNLAAGDFNLEDGSIRPKATATHPTETEINSAFVRMGLVATDPDVLHSFRNFFSARASPADLGHLVALMRADMHFGEPAIPSDLFPYILGRERPDPVRKGASGTAAVQQAVAALVPGAREKNRD